MGSEVVIARAKALRIGYSSTQTESGGVDRPVGVVGVAAGFFSSKGLPSRDDEVVGLWGRTTAAGSYKAGWSMVPVLALSITLPSHRRQAMHRVGESVWHLTMGCPAWVEMAFGCFLFFEIQVAMQSRAV